MSAPAGDDTVGSLLAAARRALAAAPADTAPREAALLLGHLLGLDEARLRARAERRVDRATAAAYRELVGRRAVGEPVAYLLGRREFYGRDFLVDARVLVPRPETEHLVEVALALELPPRPRIVDVGAGSGCIAVTLACELEAARVLASDVSLGALAVTLANARRLGVADRVACVAADGARAFDLAAVDLLVSNPPYIAPEVAESLPLDVSAHEPHEALFAADAGRSVLAALLAAATDLRPGVHLLLEIGHDQADWLRAKVASQPALELVELVRDYGGHERTAVVRRG
ncbi:MAG: peptide chain release factor N(5)-glutamine methyltransferase [Acidobacteriota bacterium]